MKRIRRIAIVACFLTAVTLLTVIVTVTKSGHGGIRTVEQFRQAAVANKIEGKTEAAIRAIFGEPRRVRQGNGYFLYIYNFRTSSLLWDTDCVIRFNASSKQVEAWQLNAD
jgi:hypothetical protein